MDIRKYLALAVASVPLACSAASHVDVQQIDCSGTLTSDVAADVNIQCSGDLTLAGGSLTSDGAVTIAADGVLKLDVPITSSAGINLIGNVGLVLGPNAKIDGPPVSAKDGGASSICAGTGASGTLGSGAVLTTGSSSSGAGLGENGSRDATALCSGNSVISFGPWPVLPLQGVESGSCYSGGGKQKFRRVRYVRIDESATILSARFQFSASPDFPEATTQTKMSECVELGRAKLSCLLYDQPTDDTKSTQLYAGHVILKRDKDDSIVGLVGHFNEKSADGCYLDSTLKASLPQPPKLLAR
ncbi:MAG: hypothetical protein FIA97_04135 [Methylococcaceae bacterium]|nr:hypothetical protein [Methylococcaceae bacterium]